MYILKNISYICHMVYIQSDFNRNLPHHFDAACALYGALDNGQDIRLTSFEEVSSGKFDSLLRTNLFVGSVEFMTEVFSRMGKNVSSMVPTQEYSEMKLEDIIPLIVNGDSFFVKPVKTKLFSGMVFDRMCVGILEKLPVDTLVWVCPKFPSRIVSEWRCYVREGRIVDSRNYSGDFRVGPDYSWASNFLMTDPICYVSDIGILEDGTNVLVENNDFWSIGNYGMDNGDYYNMLRLRYFEIVRC